ncbi:MAG: hypothetical protein A2277_03085 [Desulfobacterales bacterium RIFOXYA12_FULL_46_15]|nr:MAG: hypothetical protein A2277_03085 [Desulfobacterales bacterium RIFOXYA12_FULL_46_15]
MEEMMKVIGIKIRVFVLMLCMLLPEAVLAAGEKADLVVIVADTRGLTGILKAWGTLYNESHLYFSLLTIVLIPVIGLVFGTVADIVMRTIGIDLEHRELSEH